MKLGWGAEWGDGSAFLSAVLGQRDHHGGNDPEALPAPNVLQNDLIQTREDFDMEGVRVFSEEAFPGEADQYASIFAKEMMAKGRQEGEARLLLAQLQQRFGNASLPVSFPQGDHPGRS
ncbi:MAG: hypothetical protein HQL53_01330 [Magnetococcales bacterium]|nr:hypothetical protein [Magnetococcales bacterium]